MYDLTIQDSFESLQDWLDEVRQHSTSDVRMFLVANMLDLEEEREVRFEDAQAFAREHGLDGCYEGSAKTAANVTE
jgi:GTPase SAR1 family protein